MLESNGKNIKQHFNYHITLAELKQILEYVRNHYDPKWHLFMLVQFSLGMRCGEVAAINIYDFRNDFREMQYRQEKSNRIINEPICAALTHEIKSYITLNKHRMKDGYLFATYTGKGKFHTTETIGAYWCKLRKGLFKETGNSKWLDVSPTGKHRVSSHSLRRLHRTILGRELGKKGYTDFIIAKLCNYQDVNTFMIYRNEFELEDKKADIIMPVIEPIIKGFQNLHKDQSRLDDFFT